jgi:hypothetical protein
VCDQVGGGVEACQWSQVAFTDCGGVLQVYSTPNYIQSKYFPDNFKIGDECAWLLRADPGKKVASKRFCSQ